MRLSCAIHLDCDGSLSKDQIEGPAPFQDDAVFELRYGDRGFAGAKYHYRRDLRSSYLPVTLSGSDLRGFPALSRG